jgi:hypothetical protein
LPHECRNVFRDNLPHYVEIYLPVLVNHDVSHPNNLAPLNRRMPIAKTSRQLRRGFSQDTNLTNDRILNNRVTFTKKLLLGYATDIVADAGSSSQNVIHQRFIRPPHTSTPASFARPFS